jgi:hypothetical protein
MRVAKLLIQSTVQIPEELITHFAQWDYLLSSTRMPSENPGDEHLLDPRITTRTTTEWLRTCNNLRQVTELIYRVETAREMYISRTREGNYTPAEVQFLEEACSTGERECQRLLDFLLSLRAHMSEKEIKVKF